MSVSRIILGMATVASLMFNIACEDVDTPCVGTTCSSSTVDGGLNQADGGSLDGGKTDADIQASNDSSPDTSTLGPDAMKPNPCATCTADQVCENSTCVAKPETCEPWQWMTAHQWKCPGNLNSDIKFALNMKQGKCHATSKIFDLPASELTCDKTKKEFSFYEPQGDLTIHCVIIE